MAQTTNTNANTPAPTAGGLITPSTEGLYTDVSQIYPIVNDIFEQMTGQKNIQAVDTNSFVAMQQMIINQDKTVPLLTSLARRIGYTIDTYRPYKNKYSTLGRTQLQWGSIVQKLTVDMPDATLDKAWDVGQMQGQSIDQWIINNPKVKQRFFDNESAYAYFITIQTAYLNRAFTSEAHMQALIAQIFGKITNKREFTYEELGRLCTANLVGNLKEAQHFHMVTIYNNLTGNSLTTQQARFDPAFLRFFLSFVNGISAKFENMSVLYNCDGEERFSARADQRLYVLADFYMSMDTVPGYLSFQHNGIATDPTMMVPYWQAQGTNSTPDWNATSSIAVTNSAGSTVELKNLVAILFDYEVMGTFRHETDVLTTPVNARGRYYNTFWHENQFYYNMSDENAVAFFLD